MMIGYDHIQTALLGMPDRIICRNSVITGDNKLYSVRDRFFDQMIIQSVSVPHPVWDTDVNIAFALCRMI